MDLFTFKTTKGLRSSRFNVNKKGKLICRRDYLKQTI